MKQTETTARRMRTFDTCAHPYVYSTYQVYISKYVLYTYNMAAVLLHVVGTQVENTAVRVHVPGTHYIVHTSQQQTTIAVVVLQLPALSSAACFTLYTAA